MPRRRPHDRLDQLIECAARVFTARGYRRTQMADVARAMGVAPGTLYLYVTSKAALFDLVVQRGFRDAALPPPRLPVRTPKPGATLKHVRQRLAAGAELPALAAAVAGGRPRDARAEFRAVVRELYATVARNRRGIKLLERSALDWPELAALYFQSMRGGLLAALTAYLQRRIDQRLFRPVPHTGVAARLIVEAVAYFAMHRHGDPDPVHADEAAIEDTVLDALANAFVKEDT